MRRIIITVLVLANLYIAYNQYITYSRFNPGKDYNYLPKKDTEIDINYYDPKIVQEYYDLAYDIGNFGRGSWYNFGIDVLYEKANEVQSKNAVLKYKQMINRIKIIEAKLSESFKLKKLGYSNSDVQSVEQTGTRAENVFLINAIQKESLEKGSKAAQVIWSVQNLLIKKGYNIPQDGKFIDITEDAVKKFQKDNELLSTGIIDELTLRKLLK